MTRLLNQLNPYSVEDRHRLPVRLSNCSPWPLCYLLIRVRVCCIRPVAGQGANLAIEDAAVLAYYLQKHGVCEAALRAYEADRAPRWKKIAGFISSVLAAQRQAQSAEESMKKREALAKGAQLEYVPEVHGFQHPCLLESASAVVAAA